MLGQKNVVYISMTYDGKIKYLQKMKIGKIFRQTLNSLPIIADTIAETKTWDIHFLIFLHNSTQNVSLTFYVYFYLFRKLAIFCLKIKKQKKNKK